MCGAAVAAVVVRGAILARHEGDAAENPRHRNRPGDRAIDTRHAGHVGGVLHVDAAKL